ncbi:MAG: Aminotransferase class I and II [candidate division CPR1 bacterium GW2011_GWA2_42_17]|uniref:Aminotransferase class I and II n=1 Tax=candidate division CPR1 bacterium GW2011_GWA2_42_17 TaxID=1618341 RepID=A0A0G0Z677_9BACT|nr:MAG: Aminotransferase class I and II [candidate division CPR1 bacterium GW2011_GWA2_42_17]
MCYFFSMQNQLIGIRELAERAKQEGAIDLAQGVIDATPPAALLETIKNLPLEKYSTYNNKRGVQEYRTAIVEYMCKRGWTLTLDNVLGISGVTAGIASMLLTHCKPGARVLLPEPFFIGHKLLLDALGFKIKYLPTSIEVTPDWDNFASHMRSVDAAILTTPSNPTGHIASPAILKNLSGVAAEHSCLLIIDEMYREFIWSSPPHDSEYTDIDLSHTIILRSFSKTLAIPGWRCGFAIVNKETLDAVASTHDALYLGGSTIAQHALAIFLANNLEGMNIYIDNLRLRLQQNRKQLLTAFERIGMNPLPTTAAYYLLLRHNRSSDIAAMEELIKKKVVTIPLNMLYSNPLQDTGYIRAHFAITPKNALRVVKFIK